MTVPRLVYIVPVRVFSSPQSLPAAFVTAFVVAVTGVLCFGCGPTGSGSGPALSYGDNAEQAYERAMRAFRNDNCIDADPGFRRVRREFPYSRFAALSELRIADCAFKAKQYVEAISAYRAFVRFRPSHEKIPYARFKIAESHFEQIPSEWLLSPPNHERDQQPANEALEQLRRYLLDFPSDSEDRIEAAEDMVKKSLGVLAEHELYVARFYLRREAYAAVVMRLRTVLNRYDGSGYEPQALMMLGQAYEELEDVARARDAYDELVARYADSDEAGAAQGRLSALPAE